MNTAKSAPLAIRTALIAAMVGIALVLGLSGCGKKGAPSPPGPTDDIHYPRVYPAQ